MSLKKRLPRCFCDAPTSHLKGDVFQVVEVQREDGSISKEVQIKEKDYCDLESIMKEFPPVDEYTYENLVRAGVELREVNTKVFQPDTVDTLTDFANTVPEIPSETPVETQSEE